MVHLKGFFAALKARVGIMTICFVVVAATYFILFSHYRNFTFIGGNDFVYKIESKILDWKTMLKGNQTTSGKVGILAIDEKSLKTFGRWPFSRKYYQRAFLNLKKAGVEWVGFDVVFSEPEKTLLEQVTRDVGLIAKSKNARYRKNKLKNIDSYTKRSPGDVGLLKGSKSFENVVMGYFFFGSKYEANLNLGKKGKKFKGLEKLSESEILGIDMPEDRKLASYPIRKVYGLVGNTPYLSKATEYFGFFSNDADDDAINRWVVLMANAKGLLMPSLSLKTVAEYLNREIFVFFDDLSIESVILVNRDDESDVIEVPVDPFGTGRILVNHRGPGRTFEHFSLADAYNNSFTKKQREKLKGSVLLLGATATGINDIRPNPYDPSIDGVENHAAVMDNVIKGDFLKRPHTIFKTELLIVLCIGILFTIILAFTNAIWSGLALVVALVGYFYFDRYFWFNRGTWAYTGIPSIQIIFMYTLTTLYKYTTEEKERKKVKGAFQYYLSPDVINQVLEDPDQLSLGGDKKELTVFFSDVRGFTTISESLSPEKLCELMNDYFTPMTKIVLDSKGVLDKYIGDAIMAFWGAPIDMEDSADVACNAAIEMLYALDKLRIDFRQRGLPDIDIGIGLNTGIMSVGNMGSGERFTYTVMGDSVNLGARLEGLTKEYGIKIMISEFTQAKLTPGKFFTRDLDDIRVKGKNEPVKVFDVMRPDFLASKELILRFIENFEKGRIAYAAQEWDVAKEAFGQCILLKPEDKAANLYAERVSYYIENPPATDWDGVYTFTHK